MKRSPDHFPWRFLAAAAVAGIALPGCSEDISSAPADSTRPPAVEPETRRPNISPEVAEAIESYEADEAFAYGLGLVVGCQNGLDTYLQRHIKELLRDTIETTPSARDAYLNGYQTGQVERLNPDSDECVLTDRDL